MTYVATLQTPCPSGLSDRLKHVLRSGLRQKPDCNNVGDGEKIGARHQDTYRL